jgi:hypothetical protein
VRRRPSALYRKEDNPMNEVNDNVIEICIESIAAQIADTYAEKQKTSATEAMRMFITTKTYELLTNPKSYLYLESAVYVEDMLNAEFSGDWESWMEV